jgi:hypothetical protein
LARILLVKKTLGDLLRSGHWLALSGLTLLSLWCMLLSRTSIITTILLLRLLLSRRLIPIPTLPSRPSRHPNNTLPPPPNRRTIPKHTHSHSPEDHANTRQDHRTRVAHIRPQEEVSEDQDPK